MAKCSSTRDVMNSDVGMLSHQLQPPSLFCFSRSLFIMAFTAASASLVSVYFISDCIRMVSSLASFTQGVLLRVVTFRF